MYEWPDFADDVGDGLVVFEVVLYYDAKEGGLCVLFEDGVLDGELDWVWLSGKEEGVVGLGWVWY